MKKKGIAFALLALAFLFCCPVLPLKVHAAIDTSKSFEFELRVNGGSSTAVLLGDEIEFEVELKRTDENKKGEYTLHTMQDELIFDSRYFTLVEGSQVLSSGVDFNIRTLEDGYRKRIIISRVVMSPAGATMPDEQVLAKFSLRTKAVIQGEQISNRNYKISTKTGDTYVTTGNDVTVTVTGAEPALYAILFEGGPDASGTAPSVGAHKKGAAFELPVNTYKRDGYEFTGWYDGTRNYDEGDAYTMPNHAVTFTAQWRVKPAPTVPGDTSTVTSSPVTATNKDTPSMTSPTSPERTSPAEKESTTRPTTAPAVKTEEETGGKASVIHPVIDQKDMTDRNISVEEIEDGIIVKGKDLSGLDFDVIKPGRKGRVDLDTEEKEILIKEVEEDIIEIFIDPDGDGSFDTSIGRVVLRADNTLFIVLILFGVLSAGLISFFILKRKRLKNSSDQEDSGTE